MTRGRIGVLGGSFDPVHEGHLALARAATSALRLDALLFVPAAASPHKPAGPVAGGEDRYAMLRLAVRGEPRWDVDDLELRRPAPSWTVDTVRELGRRRPGARILLLLGADALGDFPRWRAAAEIVALCEVVPVRRPGAVLPPVAVLAATLGAEAAATLLGRVLDAATPDVSSSEIRRRRAAGESIDGLVPPAVAAYMETRGLYESVSAGGAAGTGGPR